MRLIPRRFHLKLSLVFLLLIALFAGVQTIILFKLFWKSYEELEHRLHWDIAENIAQELRPSLDSGFEIDELRRELHRISLFNPKIEIFILNKRGMVKFPPDKGDRKHKQSVPLEIIDEFLKREASRSLPVYGVDPRDSLAKREKLFSVAPIVFDNEQAYLYVLLFSKKEHSYRIGVQDYYLYILGVLSSLAIIIVIGMLGAVIFFFVTSRFREITRIVHKISQGVFDERVKEKGTDEISQLGTEVNQMTDAIVDSLEQLKEKDRLRRCLVANVSHDLGSPLTSMRAFLEIVLEKNKTISEEQRQRYLEIALANIDDVSDLVNELFELSKFEAKEIQPEREPFSVLDIVSEEVIPRLEPSARERNISLVPTYPDKLPRVYADPSMIMRVLANLVSNAIRYGNAGGQVQILLERRNNSIHIRVADDGPGIAQDDLPRIFERFYRTDEARTRSKQGSGMGLAIVKQILAVHGQAIYADSEFGSGTRFSFELPIASEDLD